MKYFAVLFLWASLGYVQGYNLPAVCVDDPLCSFVFTDDPVSQIKQCYDYETSQTCCVSCKNLIGKLGNTDPGCPWGNAGEGIIIGNQRVTCRHLTAAVCGYCSAGHLFRANCCRSCFETCPNTQ